MRLHTHRLACFACLLIGLTASSRSIAQGAPQPDETAATGDAPPAGKPKVTPPKLKQGVSVERPDGSELSALWLSLTIDELGDVTQADIEDKTGVDEELERKVLEAAYRLQFEPARVGDEAVSVRFRYQLTLTLPASAASPSEPAAPAATPPPEAPDAAPPPQEKPQKAAPPPPSPDEEPVYEATAEVEGPPEAVSSHRLEAEDLKEMPGTRGDPIRAVEVLPGVGRGDGDPILRGSSSNESKVLFDGAPVPILYHFGGITSFVQGRLVSRIDYQPGNFSARYGRISGGLINVESREPRFDKLHLMLDISMLESAALVETPIGKDTAVAVAARRSNIDFVFENFVPEGSYSVLAAPVYWDYQAFLSHHLDSHHTLRLTTYGSRDHLSLLISDPQETDPSLRGEVSGGIEFHRVQLAWESKFDDFDSRVQVTYGRQLLEQHLGPLTSEFKAHEVFARADMRYRVGNSLEIRSGLDFDYYVLDGSYQGNRPPQFEGDPNANASLASSQLIFIQDTPYTLSPAAYVEAAVRPVDPVEVTLGLRADYFEHLKAFTLDPRLGVRYAVTPETTLKAGVGRYTQMPDYYLSIPGLGNPDLKPYYAIHTSAGVEQRFGEELEVGVEGFYKHLNDRVVATADQQPPYFINDGQGRIYGAELSAKLHTGDTKGFLAYTISRSERKDRDEPYRLFDLDQTHLLSLALSQGLGKGWEVGARFRLTSGDPTTPIIGAVYDATTGQYVPRFGKVNSERLPLYHQLDLRVEKQWVLGEVKLAAYLDLINAYNAEHREGTEYSYDYTKSRPITGVPLFPSLGFRGEL
ncbi:MAG: TonB-dependent receptor [Polyangiaceae bacterium]|nr:TonB-dependent receptor [Polyangiaceae bacterium]